MKFVEAELELAQLFKAYGMAWEPACGHYVLDQSQLFDGESPFQDRVFLIHDLQEARRLAGSQSALQERLCWLLTWEDARHFLESQGVEHALVEQRLHESKAMRHGSERLELYHVIEEYLTGRLH